MEYKRRKRFLKEYKNYSISCEYKRFGNSYDNQYVINYIGEHLSRETKLKEEFLYLERVWWCKDSCPKPRDYQRSKVYKAENKVLKPLKNTFKDHLEASRFIAKVISNKWFIDNFNIRKITMHHDRRLKVSARGGGLYKPHPSGKISIPNWACNDWVVLHEIAHCCQTQPEAHGRQFCFIFLRLVRKFMGKYAAQALEREFKKEGVNYWIFGTSEPHIQEFIANGYCPF